MTNRRVMVTGIGMLTPIGNDVASSWRNALEGKSGAALIEHFDTDDYSVKISTSVKDFDATIYMDRKEARRLDLFIQYGLAAGIQAIQDAGLSAHPVSAASTRSKPPIQPC